LEDIYAALDQDHPNISGKTKVTLVEQRDRAFLSKKLASITTDVDIEILPESAYCFRDRELINPQVNDFFRSLEFKSLIPEETSTLKSFESLGIQGTHIKTAEELLSLKNRL
jgi:5'-3' exonuclease